MPAISSLCRGGSQVDPFFNKESQKVFPVGQAGLHTDHYLIKDVELNSNFLDMPESGFMDYISPLYTPTNTTVGLAAAAAAKGTNMALSHLSPVIMTWITQRSAVQFGARYGIPAGISRFCAYAGMAVFGIPTMPTWAIHGASLAASELVVLAGNGIYSLCKRGQIAVAERTVEKLMSQLIEFDAINFKHLMEKNKKDITQAKQDIRHYQHEISLYNRKLGEAARKPVTPDDDLQIIKDGMKSAEMHLILTEDRLKTQTTLFNDKINEMEALELSIIGCLEGIYRAKKDLNYKMGDIEKELKIDRSVDPEFLRGMVKVYMEKAAGVHDLDEKKEYRNLANIYALQLLDHWKYHVALNVFTK